MMNFMRNSILIIFSLALLGHSIDAPKIPGIHVTIGKTIVLPTSEEVKTAMAFKFRDGRIVSGSGETPYGHLMAVIPGRRVRRAI